MYAAQIKRLRFYTQKSKCRVGHRIKTRARSTMNSNLNLCVDLSRGGGGGVGDQNEEAKYFIYIIYAMSCYGLRFCILTAGKQKYIFNKQKKDR